MLQIVDTVSSAVNIPRELPQMVWHATLVSNTVNTLITVSVCVCVCVCVCAFPS